MPFFLLLSLVAGEPFEPPSERRPETFRGAVGLFRVSASVDTKSVAVGKPIRFVVRIAADPAVKVLSPPTRPEIEKNPDFTKYFHVEVPEKNVRTDGTTWEFVHLLRPKSESVKSVPELLFCFFNPKFGNDPDGYQEPSTDPIPIVVTAAPVEKPDVEGMSHSNFPESVRRVADDDDVLSRHVPFRLPGLLVTTALLVLPPTAALTWLLAWRRLYPDAARRAKLRRSQAAKEALAALKSARARDPARMGEHIAGILALYLNRRLDLSATTPTPGETEAHLRGLGLPEDVRTRTMDLLQTCDALRFSPMPPAVSSGLIDTSEQLILALEGWTWSASS